MFPVVCVYAFMIKLEPTCFNLDEFANHSGLLSNPLYGHEINRIPNFTKKINIILKYKNLVLLRTTIMLSL